MAPAVGVYYSQVGDVQLGTRRTSAVPGGAMPFFQLQLHIWASADLQ